MGDGAADSTSEGESGVQLEAGELGSRGGGRRLHLSAGGHFVYGGIWKEEQEKKGREECGEERKRERRAKQLKLCRVWEREGRKWRPGRKRI